MYNGIRLRVLLLAVVPVIAMSILLGCYFVTNEINSLRNNQQEKALALLENYSLEAEFWVAIKDSEALYHLAKDDLDQEIIGIVFYSKNKTELAKVGDLTLSITTLADRTQTIIKEHSTILTIPIKLSKISAEIYPYVSNVVRNALSDSSIVGWVAVEMSDTLINAKIATIVWNSTIIILIGLFISCLLALRMNSLIIKPILSIINALRKIEQGDLNIRVKTNAPGELATLESGINTMLTTLQTAHQELQNSIEQATSDLRNTLETIEIQNIELEISRKEAENASKIKSEFLASMSHELRTPLNGIIGFINLLLKTDLNARQYDYLLTIQKSSNNLLAIINDILDFSKIEAGKLYLDLEPMDIRDCIEDTLTLLAPSAHEKALELIPFFYSDVPNIILGDPLRLKQVITNLVSNSIKFTDQGSVIVRLMLEKELPNNKLILRINVEDTGKGLTEEQQKELFHSFNQLDPKITKKFGGTGLGLVICKKLIEQMNGQINIESIPLKGSIFWFTIEVEKPILTSTEAITKNHLTGIRVLVFEKHPITSLVLNHTLEHWGIIVKRTEKPEEIFTLLQQADDNKTPFQLALISINQLVAENAFLEKIINSMQKFTPCPIGILVNTTEQLLNNKKLINGISLCLAKPICRTKLYEALCNLLLDPAQRPIDYNLLQREELCILAVDDNIANLKLIMAMLENIGITVTIATNGADALKYIKEKKFSLILMDINMPDMDGIETSKAIRQNASFNQSTPIVALSAHVELNRQINMKNFINDYLKKPINEHQLKATIYKWTHKCVIPQTVKEENITIEKTSVLTLGNIEELKSIDLELGKKLAAENLELAKELFAMLIKDLPKEQNLINAAVQDNNLEALRNYAHKLHGGCCYVGVPRLKYLAKTLELVAANKDFTKITTLVNELNKEIAHVMQASFDTVV